MTLMMLAGAGIPLAAAVTMTVDRPVLASVMFAMGAAVLVMTRLAWRWMADSTDGRHCA